MLTTSKKWMLALVDFVNAPRQGEYTQYRTRYLLKEPQRQALITAARMSVERGLAHATSGEVSLRIRDDSIAMTTKQCDLWQVSDATIVTVTLPPQRHSAELPEHLAWHSTIYSATSANAVVLCQPLHALTLANAGALPDQTAASEVYAAIGGAALVEPAILGSTASAAHALLLPRIGALVWGDSLADAVRRAEALEYVARLTLLATQFSR